MLCRVSPNPSMPNTVGHRELSRPQWVNVCINEIETVPQCGRRHASGLPRARVRRLEHVPRPDRLRPERGGSRAKQGDPRLRAAFLHYNSRMVTYPPLHPTEANFVAIRSRNSLYVDKTHHFRNLLEPEGDDLLTQPDLAVRHQLLLRPRRFGKTLLINTLEAWFQGLPPEMIVRRPSHDTTLPDMPDGWQSPSWLWEGLDGADWHGVHGWHPVVKLDMSRGVADTPTGTDRILRGYLWQTAGLWHDRGLIWDTGAPGVPGPDADPASLLTHLLRRLDQAYGARPVVLVDEYDAALTEHLGSDADPTPAAAALRRFYRVLKDDEGLLYGVFVTGITRLARQHLFSAANNFTDISSDESCADLCGFTEAEVKECLAPHRDALRELEPRLDEDRMLDDWRDMYNGYRFARSSDVDQVYNPYTLTNGLRWTLANTEARLDAVRGLWPSEWSKTGTSGANGAHCP